MRAITICQPHAWAVCAGLKLYENRTWSSDYRGPLLIHAGMSGKYCDDCDMYPGCPRPFNLEFGNIIGVVDMYGSKRPSLDDARFFGFGPWCHVYANARQLSRPIGCRGKLGLWVPDAKIVAEVRRQMKQIGRVLEPSA